MHNESGIQTQDFVIGQLCSFHYPSLTSRDFVRIKRDAVCDWDSLLKEDRSNRKLSNFLYAYSTP